MYPNVVLDLRTEIESKGMLGKHREENQLDATECFIVLIILSTCFGHLYAHHHKLEAILLLLPHMVCNAFVAGGRLLGAEQQAMPAYPSALHLTTNQPA